MPPEKKSERHEISSTTRNGIAILYPVRHLLQREQADVLTNRLQSLRNKGCTRFIIDLSDCTYISSEGLGAVARCFRWCSTEPSAAMAVVLSKTTDPEVHNLFEIIGLARTIGSAIRPSREDALTYLKNFS